MNNPNELYQHLIRQFQSYSVKELIHLNNDLVINEDTWGSNRQIFRTAVLNALSKKGIDLSAIITKQDGFTIIEIVAIELCESEAKIYKIPTKKHQKTA